VPTKITLIVPTLNEIEGMKDIMPRVRREWFDQILIIDGRSTDGTVEYARERGYQVFVQENVGIRSGYVEAMPLIEGDIIVTFSPDGNSIPEILPDLIKKIREGYDMVIVSRYLGDAKSEDDDIVTSFGNWFFTKTVNLLFGSSYTDTMVIYRAYRKALIEDLHLDRPENYRYAERLFLLPQGGLSWEPLLSVRAAMRKLRVTEIPGDEPARIGGERKLRVVRWGGAIYVQFLWEFVASRLGARR